MAISFEIGSEHLTRPSHLPDFKEPPINEVVLGVQFATPRGYSQIRAHEVWQLYRSDYPTVQEHQALAPAFETFGIPSAASPEISFISGASHDRFWFLSATSEELIQFQQDRLLHNWRKVKESGSEYPRFERMIAKFEEELETFENYASKLAPQALRINQCEVTYINHISVAEESASLRPADWLTVVGGGAQDFDDFATSLRQILKNGNKPFGRLIVNAATARRPDGKKLISLNITVRGSPSGAGRSEAIQFLKNARDVIVCKFAEITTKQAHDAWGRTQ